MVRWREDPKSGCWIWTGRLDRHGYGEIDQRIGGRSVPRRAHRVVYEDLVGPIPEGLELDHTCVVPSCVNPAHMEPVTHAENMRRVRERRVVCRRGHSMNDAIRRSNGHRQCRTCKYASNRRWNAKSRRAG